MSIKKRILCLVLVVFITGMSFISCAGTWAAFNKSSNLIANIGGKYIGGVVYWIVGPIVSPIALFLDVFIFNVIEFWTGSNLIAYGNTFEQIDSDGNYLAAIKNDDGSLTLRVTEATGEITDILLERDGNDFYMFDADGVLMSSYTVPHEELIN